MSKNKKNKFRTIIKTDNNQKIIYYEGIGVFDKFNLKKDVYSKTLSIGCNFIDYGEKDIPINRRIKLTKKNALYLIYDLIKYVLTNKI